MNKDFLKQVLAGEKELLRKDAVAFIEVPHYDELSVKALWPQLAGDESVAKFFPDKFAEGKGPGREYFFNVVNTVLPDFLKQMLDHANKQRMTAEGEKGQAESIQISQFWEEQLKAMPYLSRKCHRSTSFSFFLSFRESWQDAAFTEGAAQADPERSQAQKNLHSRHLRAVQRLEVEGTGAEAVIAGSILDAATEQPSTNAGARQHPATPRGRCD